MKAKKITHRYIGGHHQMANTQKEAPRIKSLGKKHAKASMNKG